MGAKRFLVPALLAFTLAAVAIALRGRGRLPDAPEDAVRAFFAAAQEGDAAAYLSLLSEPLRSSFTQTQSGLGAVAYRESLRNSVAGLKGFAISRSGETSDDRAALDVELVFADRSERQRFELNRRQRGWLIAALGRAEAEKPAEPYGTVVYDFGPSSDPRMSSTGTTATETSGR